MKYCFKIVAFLFIFPCFAFSGSITLSYKVDAFPLFEGKSYQLLLSLYIENSTDEDVRIPLGVRKTVQLDKNNTVGVTVKFGIDQDGKSLIVPESDLRITNLRPGEKAVLASAGCIVERISDGVEKRVLLYYDCTEEVGLRYDTYFGVLEKIIEPDVFQEIHKKMNDLYGSNQESTRQP